MINFPTNPSVNDQYEFQGKVWRWTGSVWSIVSAGDDGTSYELVNGGAQFVLNANGSVTFNDGTIQSTAYTGAANGEYVLPTATTSTLGGVKIDGVSITIANGIISAGASDLSGYQTIAGLSANVAKLTSNNSLYLGGLAANQYAYANAIPSLSGYQTTAGLSANVATLTSNNTLYLGGVAANQYAYANVTYTQILWINPSPSPATTFRTNIEATDHGAQIDISTGMPGFGSVYTWVLDETGISFPNGAGIQTVPFVGDADLLGGIAADQYAYANSLASYQTTAGLSANVAKLTANNTSFVGTVSAANVVSNAQLTANLANYQTTAGLSANVATLTANNTSFVGTVSAANIVSNAQLTANLANYQTTAGLSANVATLTANNTLYLGGVAANQYSYANTLGTNISTANAINITSTATTGNNYFNFITSATTNRHGFSVNDGTRFGELLLMKSAQTGYGSTNEIVLRSSGASAGLRLVGTGTTPRITFTTGISTTTSSDQFRINDTANSVNYLQVTGNITGSAPSITAQGSDTDIDITATPKGSGKFNTTSIYANNSITSNAATAFIAGTAAESGVALQMPREGALRNLYNGANFMYFDVSNGGTTHGGFQFRSSSAFTNVLTMSPTGVNFNTGASITGQTPTMAKLPWNSAIDTELTVEDFRFRISNQGGIFPQIISNTGGSKNTAWTGIGAISGYAVTQLGSTGTIVPNNSWTTLFNGHGMDNSGDTVTVTLQDKAQGRIYRITFMRSDNGTTTGYNIIAERLL